MKNIGIRTKIIIITLTILGGGFFIAPEILEEVAETRYRGTLEDGRQKLVERLEKDYEKINLRNTPRIGDYFVFVYDKESGKLIREYSFFPPRLIDDFDTKTNKFSINNNEFNFVKTESLDGKVSIVVGFNESTPRNIVEGISIFKTLSWKKVHDLSYKDYHFEHAGSIINEKSSHFKKLFLKTPKNIQLKNTRFSIDTISDYQFFLLLFQKINTENLSYGLAIKYYKKLKHINSHVVQRGLKSNFKKKIKKDGW